MCIHIELTCGLRVDSFSPNPDKTQQTHELDLEPFSYQGTLARQDLYYADGLDSG